MGLPTVLPYSISAVVITATYGLAVVGGPPAAADPTAGRGNDQASRQVGDCTAAVLDPQAVTVYPASQQPYELLVQGAVHLDDPGRAAGCTVRVCVEEQNGPGNWHAKGCGVSTVDPAVADYYSLTLYVDCDNFDDTGDYRSYVRFEDSALARVGVSRAVCS